MNIYLYHKRHTITNLNYFGKTKNDPYTYNGSGVYWNNHLRKHGKHIETVQVWKFDNLDECSKFAIDFSNKNNIVESTEWANLCIENALSGGDKFSSMTPEKLADINARKSNSHIEVWKVRSKDEQSDNTKLLWNTRDRSTINDIANKISNTLLAKTAEQRAETLRKRHETASLAHYIICPHCSKIGKNASNMRRYHFNNCKLYNR
jgi:hypothetical protein